MSAPERDEHEGMNRSTKGADQVEVWSKQVAAPIALRYAWADNPVCNFYDQKGLPVTPFRTDEWPGFTAEVFQP
ncbi:MAG: sialate O-acetylesterase [Kiritimatiellia bacterium]